MCTSFFFLQISSGIQNKKEYKRENGKDTSRVSPNISQLMIANENKYLLTSSGLRFGYF